MTFGLFDRLRIGVSHWYVQDISAVEFDQVFGRQFSELMTLRVATPGYRSFDYKTNKTLSGRITVTYDRSRNAIHIKLKLGINGIRLIRQQFPMFVPKNEQNVSLDGKWNWLPETFPIDGYLLAAYQRLEIVECIRSECRKVVDAVERARPSSTEALVWGEPVISIHLAEICWDRSVERPRTFVSRLRNRFWKEFRMADASNYGHKQLGESKDKNSLCLVGQSMEGETQKIYAKTWKRVRYETIFSGDRIRQIRGSNVLAGDLVEALRNLSADLSNQSSSVLCQFWSRAEVIENGNVLELLFESAKACTSPEEFQHFIESISLNQVLCSDELHYPLIGRLKKRGVIEKVSYATYKAKGFDPKTSKYLRRLM